MRFLIQRVNSALVRVDENIVGHINKGLLVFVGVGKSDSKTIADKLINKLVNLRIFDDQDGKTNLSIKDVSGELLIISQFTLFADCKKGNRPSFINAKEPTEAKEIYEYIVNKSKEYINTVEEGVFGADMKVELINDGPFTIYLDSDYL